MNNSKSEKFSKRHPILSGITAAYRTSKETFNSNPKSVSEAFKNASQATTNAAKKRTYNDNYSIKDRVNDLITDWGDVENSGTANMVETKIKELNDSLINIDNALDSLRKQQANFPPGTFMFDLETGEIKLGPGISDKKALENIRQIKDLTEMRRSLISEIKIQSENLNINRKTKGVR